MSDFSWYKDAIFYELRVRSFADSDGDGIGDFRGLTQKLDYLQDLGVSTIWLLPFYPSPLRDDGYDIADYCDVHPSVGTLKDFRALVRQAHRRDLKIVTELVLNHTSDQHRWFQRARRAPAGSVERDFYVWSDTPDRYADARIIFTDYETSNWAWDPVAKAYYWHRFFSHQPDLNFDHPPVRKALFDVVDFWLGMGVDGLRLDAVPYLFQREGTSCENLPETHEFLRTLRAHVDKKFRGRMLLAEANQWPEDAAAYFGGGNECHMAFHFPIMPRLYLALRMEDSFPILDILEQTPSIPDSTQWAIFLRNHDELTLEMVTEEERDLMLRAYAREPQMRLNLGIRRRLAPLLDNSRRRMELMNALLFSLPGTPVIYYGDEIGMGDNVYLGDRNGVRTPMQWSPDRNAGFSAANPQSLFLPPVVDPEYHYETINVENQQKNPSSLLWWMKRVIALRKQYLAFGFGSFEALAPANRSVLAFLRRHAESVILVVANLSRFTQCVDLQLNGLRGRVPVELFGHTRFPAIGTTPYRLTLGAHDFYWFSLELPASAQAGDFRSDAVPAFPVGADWPRLLDPERENGRFEQALARWIRGRRWFRSKSRVVKRVRPSHVLALNGADDARLTLLEVSYSTGEPETYVALFGVRPGVSENAIAVVTDDGAHPRSLVEVSDEPEVARRLFEIVCGRRSVGNKQLAITGQTEAKWRPRYAPAISARRLGVEQSNTSFAIGEEVVMKLLRKLEDGPSVEVEMLRELAPSAAALGVPAFLGSLELARPPGKRATVASFIQLVPNQGDAWQFTLDEIWRFMERVLTRGAELKKPRSARRRLGAPSSGMAIELAGGFLEAARQLGRQTAGLHQALAAAREPAFVPHPFGGLARRAAYQALRTQAVRGFDALKTQLERLPDSVVPLGRAVLKRRSVADRRFRALLDAAPAGVLQRIHGDFHLGQVLYAGGHFNIIDFEGEPGRSLAERRRRRSPLVDVAGMLRSFHYAVEGALRGDIPLHGPRDADLQTLAPWARAWFDWVSSAFLNGYLEVISGSGLVPGDGQTFERLLDAFTIEKALYELRYELDNRPAWVAIPLAGLADLLGTSP